VHERATTRSCSLVLGGCSWILGEQIGEQIEESPLLKVINLRYAENPTGSVELVVERITCGLPVIEDLFSFLIG
jgi:hypothetical protein